MITVQRYPSQHQVDVRFPYDPALVAGIRAASSGTACWVPGARCWEVYGKAACDAVEAWAAKANAPEVERVKELAAKADDAAEADRVEARRLVKEAAEARSPRIRLTAGALCLVPATLRRDMRVCRVLARHGLPTDRMSSAGSVILDLVDGETEVSRAHRTIAAVDAVLAAIPAA